MANINNNTGMIMYRDIFGQRVIQAPKKQESKTEVVELQLKVKVVKKLRIRSPGVRG